MGERLPPGDGSGEALAGQFDLAEAGVSRGPARLDGKMAEAAVVGSVLICLNQRPPS
jgi:hypothetical protein